MLPNDCWQTFLDVLVIHIHFILSLLASTAPDPHQHSGHSHVLPIYACSSQCSPPMRNTESHRFRPTANVCPASPVFVSPCQYFCILPTTKFIINIKLIHQNPLENVQLSILLLCHTRVIVIVASLSICRPMYLIEDQGGMIDRYCTNILFFLLFTVQNHLATNILTKTLYSKGSLTLLT